MNYIIINRIDLREVLDLLLGASIKINKVSFNGDETKIFIDDVMRVKGILNDKVRIKECIES